MCSARVTLAQVRDPVDLTRNVRAKFLRNEEFIKRASEITGKFNSRKRIFGPMNLLLLSKQYKRVNNNMVKNQFGKEKKSEFRWILPQKESTRDYYNKHQDACYCIPKDCGVISLTFSAENAKFDGGSIRVRFYKKRQIQIFTKTIILPGDLITNCWEFKIPKEALYYSVSFRLHPIKDEDIKAKIPTRRMTLRSDTTTKEIHPVSGKWCYRNIQK